MCKTTLDGVMIGMIALRLSSRISRRLGLGCDQSRFKDAPSEETSMSAIRFEQRVSGTPRWTIALLALSVLLYAQSGEAADGIKFFKNYFVTGD